MNSKEGAALDHYLTTTPWDCEEDGHKWVKLGVDSEGTCYYKCSVCGQEDEG